jgi:hypothetical protein
VDSPGPIGRQSASVLQKIETDSDQSVGDFSLNGGQSVPDG